jgi:5-methylthioadenosine/S-adenosylhomocysteine deaminase
MTDAPVSIDLLVQNAVIVTFDDEGTVLTDGAIAIDGGDVVAIGPTAELSAQFAPTERIFAEGLIAMPGLIDAHLHTAQTMMKGLLPEMVMRGTLRQPFWREYLIPFESNMTADDMHLSGQLAYTAMLQSGTTTFFDAGGPHPDAAARAAQEIGIRGVVARSTLDVAFNIPQSMQLTTEQAIAENIGLVERWPAGGLVTGAMGLRQIMNCSPELIVAIHDEARSRGVKVHTHLLEGLDEIDYAIELYGKRPIEFLIDRGVFTDTLHCAHSVYATPSAYREPWRCGEPGWTSVSAQTERRRRRELSTCSASRTRWRRASSTSTEWPRTTSSCCTRWRRCRWRPAGERPRSEWATESVGSRRAWPQTSCCCRPRARMRR